MSRTALKLYLDEDAMRHGLVRALRAHGLDAVTVAEAGMLRGSDEAQLAWAAGSERVLYSFNLGHFHVLHTEWLAAGKDHSGIILGQQQRYAVGEQVRRLLNVVNTRTAGDMRNRLEYLSAWRP